MLISSAGAGAPAPQAGAASANGLQDLARELAQQHVLVPRPAGRARPRVGTIPLRHDIEDLSALFENANRHFRETPELESLSAAAEWMLDNFYLVQQTLRLVRDDMPPGFYRELPQLAAGPLAGHPRIYAVAQYLVVSQTARLDLEQVKRFIQQYQDVAPLAMGELWALPTMLRLCTLECLARALARITALAPPRPPAAEIASDVPADEIVANCIISLRTLATEDWELFFECVSLVERVLAGDPAGVYAEMDQKTRDRYRKVVEQLSRDSHRSEQAVASEAVGLAAQAAELRPDALAAGSGPHATQPARDAHVGYYLASAGRAQLEARLSYHPDRRRRMRRAVFNHPTAAYLGGITLVVLVTLLGGISYALGAGATALQALGAGVLLLIPAVTLSVSLVNWIVTLTVTPRVLPKMDFRAGIPAECRTMVVIPAMLTQRAEVASLVQQLEMQYLRNQDAQLCFALLSDFGDAAQPHMPADAALVEQAQAGIQALNAKYGRAGPSPFYLFHRARKWNPSEDLWMGWERKRGKLHELNGLLRGGSETAFSVQEGDPQGLRAIKYMITLDADTILPSNGARRLVATLAHPLNRAELDPHTGAVVAGYTVLQPRTETTPTSTNRSLFTRIFAGDIGLDLYTHAASDVYQDLFGEGSYVGKGIYDIDAFELSIAGRIPDNALLSHDLFEGIHGRVSLVTDVVLLEDYPPHYLVAMSRQRRWVRGDWQLLPWLLPRVPSRGAGAQRETIANDLSVIDRWKIVDNLRRSLMAPALLVLIVAGWLWLPGAPVWWTVVAAATLAVPLLTSSISGLIQSVGSGRWQGLARPLLDTLLRWLLALAFLPYEALVMLVTILDTSVRVFVTHRHLLQWTTAAHSARRFGDTPSRTAIWREMLAAVLVALSLTGLIVALHPAALAVAAPLLIAWLLAPQIADWIGRPMRRAPVPLSAAQRRQLRHVARRTWLFFERFVGPEDHWLPPDHFQESPGAVVAHSTSPTNIGLLLLATLAAYDQGYIELLDLVARLRSTFGSLEKLERYRGHLLNWYDTRSLEPLAPRYVSTVDSGNLAACLRTLGQACQALLRAPLLRWQTWEGLLDTFGLLDDIVQDQETTRLQEAVTPLKAWLARTRREVAAIQPEPAAWMPLLSRLCTTGQSELDGLLMALVESHAQEMDAETLRRLRIALRRVRNHLESAHSSVELMLPWLSMLTRPPQLFADAQAAPAIREAWLALQAALPAAPTLDELPEVLRVGQAQLARLQSRLDQAGSERAAWVPAARDWCAQLEQKLEHAPLTARVLSIGLQELDQQAESDFQAMDFGFLFDPHPMVFRLGYNVDSGTLDANCYDLLASEARIASVVAIAKQETSPSHWLHLGRPLTLVSNTRALLSWSGTMFEYLMPSLLMKSYEGTLLQHSCRAAVDYQIEYGARKGVPWGISECGFFAFDAGQNYQYRAFGAPGLGLKRNLAQDLVVTPYASLMALSLRPHAVLENIARLTAMDMLGAHGFYEAVDFTPSRLALGERYAVVRSYMAHHQGMIMLALDNYLHDDLMVRRFHSDPRVQSVELLLQEKVPEGAPAQRPPAEDSLAVRRAQAKLATQPWDVAVDTPVPLVHFLSNGRYGVLLTGAGSGFSRWQETDLTRWRADTTLDNHGTWIYVRDLDSGDLWSAAYQPVAAAPESQSVQYHAHMAEFRRSDHGIAVSMQVVVAPDDDVEIRRLSVTNHSDRVRRLTLTSYGEVVLAPQATDQRHPAFNKMFVESSYLPGTNTLLFRRRPRQEAEEPIYLAHALALEPGQTPTRTHATDRAQFLGRGQTLRAPETPPRVHATLDPILSLGQELELQPHATAQVAFLTVAARSRQKALELCARYQSWRAIEQAFEQARSRAESELRRLSLGTPDLEAIQQLLSVLVYPHAGLRADAATLAANRRGQSGLWGFGISGDYPILLLRVNSQAELGLVQQMLQAHTYWRGRQLKIDLVILDMQATGYAQELRGQLQRVLVRAGSDTWLNRRGGIFVLSADKLDADGRALLETAARAALDGSQGPLAAQLEPLRRQPTRLPPFVPAQPELRDAEPAQAAHLAGLPVGVARPAGLLFDNGLGGFSADGREYVIYLQPGQSTPAPWINVIANPDFGFLVSEAGSATTWSVNSGENRLTPWSNDPIVDPPGEALFLRDEETAQVWSPTPQPMPAAAPYLIRHGAGYSIFEHASHGLKQELTLFAVRDAPVKVIRLRLENTWDRGRRITATFYAEWLLGNARDAAQQYVLCEFDGESQALLARNPYNAEFGERVAFAAASHKLHGLTADRAEFLGRMGSPNRPAALERIGLAGAVAPGLDPCAALQLHIDLEPGQAQEIYFLLGEAANREAALGLVRQYQDAQQVQAAWVAASAWWQQLLCSVQVQTPDPAMNLLLNGWLLYQTLACRIWGRSAFYQSGGAFGFRDQLQDVMALEHVAPGLTRAHILEAARQQFEAGDVLHWWHPPTARGVRTRCSDDLLWLPFVVTHYVESTGDESILDERVPFRRGAPLEAGEAERYDQYAPTGEAFTLYEHCRRALEHAVTAGPHGLPLIGSGDWNDGLNRVGIEGKGESVWLAWFLCATLNGFAGLCERRGAAQQAAGYRQSAAALRAALEAAAWDGEWYLRAFFDDGTPLGSAQARECQIDSIAQSWAVLSGAGDPERAAQAMQSVVERLVNPHEQIALLFTPPFDKTLSDPGYIKGYAPGIRENGGQYTHAALWTAWAFAEQGQGDRAEALFRLLNPIYHGDTPAKVARYQVEPYVVAADVYSRPPHAGRGGWTWYTGSSGWMYRLGLEAILGLRRSGQTLHVNPCIPRTWTTYQVTYRYGATVLEIGVENPAGVNRGVRHVLMDGVVLPGGTIPLVDDGALHRVQVLMG